MPKDVLFASWTRLDLLYAIVDKFLMGFVLPSVAAMVVAVSRLVQMGLDEALGSRPMISQTTLSLVVFLISSLVIRDFVAFYVHLMQHRIPLLWEFHKVHHAPESLTPPSGRRLHPFDQFPGMMAEVPLLGLVVGAYAWLTQQGIETLILCAVGFYYLAHVITFAPLRHSHINLRLGVFEHFLISPAHHRLHHSAEQVHWDRNFASIFSVWDRLFGTLLEPPVTALYRLGLPNGESTSYATLRSCYLEPFRQIRAQLRGEKRRRLASPDSHRARIHLRDMLRIRPPANTARRPGSTQSRDAISPFQTSDFHLETE